MAYPTSNDYKNIIYSGDSQHKLKIWFNEVELVDADLYCEEVSVSTRVLPDDESRRFSLDNFVSEEITVILHNVPIENIVDKVKISIGTLVDEDNDTYEYVPLGIFNIQDAPETDKEKVTIKLRDNSVLFDFNYNAQPLIEANGGSVTKMQILNDICTKANVTHNISTFLGDTDEIGIYDNSITARVYITYLAEQAGAIAKINRNGELVFIYLNNLTTKRIPLSVVEKYEIGDKYKISRVVYEDAIRKFEAGTDTYDTLYLNAGNPYISTQSQIDAILNIVNNFEIDSLTTGKILCDPSIDPYDIIEIYDDEDENETVIARTLANANYKYNGVLTVDNYTTKIGLEERKENVTVSGEPSFKKYAKTNIDNLNASVQILTTSTEEISNNLSENYYTIQMTNELVQNAERGVVNTFTQAGGNNLLRNTAPYFMTNDTEAEFWDGAVARITDTDSSNGYGLLLQNGSTKQTVQLKNNYYTISFKYKRKIPLTTASVKYNGKTISLTEEEGYKETTGLISEGSLTFEAICDTNNGMEIYELMLNTGEVALEWSQNANEMISDYVQISKGVKVSSSVSNTLTTMESDGFKVKNKSTNETVMEATETGARFKEITAGKGTIAGLLIEKVEDEVWITGV